MPTRFLRNWIQSHYSEKVLINWQAEESTITRLEVSVRSAAIRPIGAKPKPPELPTQSRDRHNVAQNGVEMRASVPFMSVHEALGGSPLDPRLAFETFIVGRSNTLAHAAARQVATSRRGDPLMFNPLYLHAGVGLGKTHLLQAVTWAGNSGDRKVLYLTAERFMYGFVSALRTQTTLAFKEAVRAIDVLMIDDLQFLQGRSTRGRVLPHSQCPHRRRPPGCNRERPSAGGPRKSRRPCPFAPCRRTCGRDRFARRRVAARNPQEFGSPPRAPIIRASKFRRRC